MRITILTAFPDLIKGYLDTSVLGRGISAGRLEVETLDIRDFAEGRYRQIDDYAYGGGGMVLMAGPVKRALESVRTSRDTFVVYPSPQGVRLHQELVEDLSRKKHLVIVCGRYEGIDERFVDKNVDLEISIGDFVLTGGEMPAMAIVDAVSRLIPGVVGKAEAVSEDSFFGGMLDTPHYTRPSEWDGAKVPEVLLSGDEGAVRKWRRRQSVERTLKRRPDLVGRAGIMPWLSRGAYVMEVHYPVINDRGKKTSTTLTGSDLRDISRLCRMYGIKKYLLVTPMAQQREIAKKIIAHRTGSWNACFNGDRSGVFSVLKIFASINRALKWVGEREKTEPFKIATTARHVEGAVHWISLKRRILEEDLSPVFIFGTGRGLHEEVLKEADSVMTPISGGLDGWNNISLGSAVGITLDRFFGWR